MRRPLFATPTALVRILFVVGAVAWLVVTALPGISRSGYVLDEDLTAFAVVGICRDGLPTLPSGALYERGLPYSYLAAFASLCAGRELAVYRALSLVLGALSVVVMFEAGRRAGRSALTGITACWLVALNPWMAVSSSWARFYSFSTLTLAGGLAAFASTGRLRRIAFPVLVLIASLVHEAGQLLALFPLVAVVSRDEQFRDAGRSIVVPSLLAVASARLLVLGLNFLVPHQDANPWIAQQAVSSSWFALPGRQLVQIAGPVALVAMMCAQTAAAWFCARRQRSSVGVLMPAAVLATVFHVGMIGLWLMLVALIVPERLRVTAWHAAAAVLLAIAGWWAVFAVHGIAAHDVESWRGFLALGFVGPADVVRFLTTKMPLTVALLALSGTLASASVPSALTRAVRLALSFAVAVVVVLSYLDIGLVDRYLVLLLPGIALALAAIPQLLTSWLGSGTVSPSARLAIQLAGAALTAAVAVVDWHVLTPPLSFLTPVDITRVISAGAAPAPGEAVITNDDIASAFNLGRADYWFVESARDLERYRLNTPNGARGVYSGAEILVTPAALDARTAICSRKGGCLFAVFRTGRFPFTAFERQASELTTKFDGAEVVHSDSLTLLRIRANGRVQ